VNYAVNIPDASGHEVDVIYNQEFVPLVDGLEKLDIPTITATGYIDFIDCDMASSAGTEKLGG